MALLNVLSTGRKQNGMTIEQKQFVLDLIQEAKGLVYSQSVIEDLLVQISSEIERIEFLLGSANPSIRLLLELLRV